MNWLSITLLSCGLAAFIQSANSATKADVLGYLRSISGTKTITGQYNREPNSEPAKWTNVARSITGKYPGLWGGNFGYWGSEIDNRQKMIDEAKSQWKAGSMVALTLNVCPPTIDGERCNWGQVQARLSDSDWTQLVTDGTPLNNKWKRKLDIYAYYMKQLTDAGVVVIFRPFQEINGNWFWFANRQEENGSKRLFQLTRNHVQNVIGLKNIIWEWCVSDMREMPNIAKYWPGNDFVDVVSLDVYDQRNPQPKQEDYQRILSIAGDKPVAVGEAAQIVSPETLKLQPKWVWFTVWAEYLSERVNESGVSPNVTWNSDMSVRYTYGVDRTLKRGEIGIKF